MANRTPHPKCGARKDDGSTCEASAGAGTPHLGYGSCKHHGGCTPSHIKKAENEVARRAVDTYGLPRDIAPAKALLEEVARTAGHVDWLADVVRSLDPDALVWGKTKEESGRASEPQDTEAPAEVDPTTITRTAGPSVWLALYQWERKHLTDVSKTAIAAGIAERQVKLAEETGHVIADVLRRVFADPELGLTDEQRRAVPVVARRHLSLA